MEEDDLPDDDPAVEYWIPFVRRMRNIPMEYQLAIIDEYEKGENTGKDMKVERMWDCQGPRYSPAQVHDNSPPVLLINDMIQTALIGIKRFVFAG